MTFWPNTIPDAGLSYVFILKLEYIRETNNGDLTKPYTAGALEKPD
jgi:hypothetical protein